VPASFLLVVFDSVYVMALTAWIGSVLFFSFGVAPIIFTVLGAESGGRFVRALFPRYYLWGAICGAVALPAYVAVPLCYPEFRGPKVGVQALAIIVAILIELYAGHTLTPAINRARDGGASEAELFERLHRRAVGLNALVLVIGMVLLVAFAARSTPRTSGIVELTPVERARYGEAVSRVLEDVEAKYGFRRAREAKPGEPDALATQIAPEAVKELEGIFAQKRLREQARRKRAPE
jgi:Domain of unknown function (DUF4149)